MKVGLAYRVIPFNAVGDGATSTISATTQLAGPGDLKVVAFSGGRIDLSWSDRSANETGYEVSYRRWWPPGSWRVRRPLARGAGSFRARRSVQSVDDLHVPRPRDRSRRIGSSSVGIQRVRQRRHRQLPRRPGVPTLVAVIGTRLDLGWSAVAGVPGTSLSVVRMPARGR